MRWDIDEPSSASAFRRGIEVTAINEPGTLAQIAQVIADNDGNIANLDDRARRARISPSMIIDVEVCDLEAPHPADRAAARPARWSARSSARSNGVKAASA